MRVILDDDLWLVQYPDGELRLSPPWVRMLNGRSASGLCAWPVKVLHRGTEVTLDVPAVAETATSTT